MFTPTQYANIAKLAKALDPHDPRLYAKYLHITPTDAIATNGFVLVRYCDTFAVEKPVTIDATLAVKEISFPNYSSILNNQYPIETLPGDTVDLLRDTLNAISTKEQPRVRLHFEAETMTPYLAAKHDYRWAFNPWLIQNYTKHFPKHTILAGAEIIHKKIGDSIPIMIRLTYGGPEAKKIEVYVTPCLSPSN